MSFLPGSRNRMIFTVLMLVASTYDLTLLPFRFVFLLPYAGTLAIIDALINALYLLEIAICFYQPYTDQGRHVTDRQKTSSYYLRSWFTLDLISSFPLDTLLYLSGIIDPQWILLWRLPRLLRVFRIFNYFRYIKRYAGINPGYLRLTGLAYSVALFIHNVGCFWYWLHYLQEPGLDTWLEHYGLTHAGMEEKYLYAVYWALTTMTTVGYGDITPQTTLETLYTMFVMAIGAALYAYLIGNLASVIAEMDHRASAHNKLMEKAKDFVFYKKLPPELGRRILAYYDYLWEFGESLDEKKLLDRLPRALQTDVALYLHKDLLQKVPLFQECSPAFIASLVHHLKLEIYAPGDKIITQGDVGKEMYFVNEGTLTVIDENTQETHAELGPGHFFGELALLYSVKRTATVKSHTFARVYVLRQDDLMEVLDAFPEFTQSIAAVAKERYEEIHNDA